jgi:hypothetical protein
MLKHGVLLNAKKDREHSTVLLLSLVLLGKDEMMCMWYVHLNLMQALRVVA